jgi:hypothetical protein
MSRDSILEVDDLSVMFPQGGAAPPRVVVDGIRIR